MNTLHSAALVLASSLLLQPTWAQGTPTQQTLSAPNYQLQPRPIATDTWVIEGAVDDFSKHNGCNIINTGFIDTPEGVLVINTGVSRLYGEQQRQAIQRITHRPVLRVLNLNLHPDYFFGNQAWADVPTQALAGSIQGMKAEGGAYEDNLYRLCGDWMQGTVSTPARDVIQPGRFSLGQHQLELLRLEGHTADDLLLIDHSTGVVFTGGLVFTNRVPTAPHARLAAWQHSLQHLQDLAQQTPFKVLVPSHGPVRTDGLGLQQTVDWLQWLDQTLRQSADKGLDLGEVLRLPIPSRFANWAAQPAEYIRSVTYLYPGYEKAALNATVPE